MRRGNILPIAVMAFAIVAFLMLVFLSVNQPATNSKSKLVACTLETKLCPDGSYVGRTGPNCAFAECPETNTNTANTNAVVNTNTATEPTAGWKTYTDTTGGFSFQMPQDWQVAMSDNVSGVLLYPPSEQHAQNAESFYPTAGVIIKKTNDSGEVSVLRNVRRVSIGGMTVDQGERLDLSPPEIVTFLGLTNGMLRVSWMKSGVVSNSTAILSTFSLLP